MLQNPRRFLGFTLIELMIVVVVIAILAAIAFPAYQNFVRNAQRSDGMTALMGIALAQERHRANNAEYADNDDLIAGTLAGVGVLSPKGRYDLAITAAEATSFTATATKRDDGGISDPGCSPLTLEYDGNTIETEPEGCWRD
jgi:type IV pilus assembly protein PilE